MPAKEVFPFYVQYLGHFPASKTRPVLLKFWLTRKANKAKLRLVSVVANIIYRESEVIPCVTYADALLANAGEIL